MVAEERALTGMRETEAAAGSKAGVRMVAEVEYWPPYQSGYQPWESM